MKKMILIIGCFAISITGFTQSNVLNPSFENWTNVVLKDSIEHWMTSTISYQSQEYDVDNAYQVGGAYHGMSAVHLETVFYYDTGSGQNDTLIGYIVKNGVDQGNDAFPYSDTVDTFTFWYKSNVLMGDTAVAVIQLRNGGSIYAEEEYKITGVQTTWTKAVVPLVGASAEVPDSVFIGFASSNPYISGVPKEGSWLEVDSIAFEFNSGSMTLPSGIPNNSFENSIEVTSELPDDWFTFDKIALFLNQDLYSSKSMDASDGLYSLSLETTASNSNFGIPAATTNGTFDFGLGTYVGGDVFLAQATQFLVDVKYMPSGADTAIVWLQIWNNSSGILVYDFIKISGDPNWSTKSLNLSLTEAPDSIFVFFESGEIGGSVLLIDNIRFTGGDVGIHDSFDEDVTLDVFPNPSHGILTINYESAEEIKILDFAGKQIYFNNNVPAKVLSLDVQQWKSGIYIVQVKSKGKILKKKLILN